MAFMILVNNPGTWGHIFDPLEHAYWHGLTPTDLVFPFFLFAVGNAMAFVIPGLRAEGDQAFYRKVITRTVLIFLIGTFLNWFPFSHWIDGELVPRGWEWVRSNRETAGIRVMGTLQRIALCYFFASVIVYNFGQQTVKWIAAVTLVAYWLLCILANPADPFSFKGWFGKEIDLAVFGAAHVYRGDGSKDVAPGNYSRTFVGDESDTSPFGAKAPVPGISTKVYIRNMAALIEALEAGKNANGVSVR